MNLFDGLGKKFIITDKAIYNMKRKMIKRRIPIDKISALFKCVPPSKNTSELTIHAPGECDYRIDCKDK